MNILITGGTSGLGRAIIDELASQADNDIFFTYCHNAELAREIEARYPSSRGLKADFTDADSIHELSCQLSEETVDVLIHNAYSGDPVGTHFHKTAPDNFRTAFEHNIMPFIEITQACLPGMRKRRFGKIITILTSYLIDVPPTGFSVYTATKAYLRQLSKSICREYGRYNVVSNCLLPEFMPTGFGHVEDFQLDQLKAAHPLKHLLQPKEVAEIVVSLIRSSQQLNGVEIPINAAQHIM